MIQCNLCGRLIAGTHEDPVQNMGFLDCCTECRVRVFPDAVMTEAQPASEYRKVSEKCGDSPEVAR